MVEHMKDKTFNGDDDFPITPATLMSKCCGSYSITQLYETKLGNIVGVCSVCKESTTFEPEIEDERQY